MEPNLEKLAVAVRVRPWLTSDGVHAEPAVRCIASNRSVRFGDEAPMTFDAVFPPETEQSEVYQALAAPLIERVFSGENACLMAFGQTGSGKSHTMLGGAGGRRSGDGSAGCIPLAAGALFRRTARMEEDASAAGSLLSFQVRASFLEIHRGLVFDLLGGTNPRSAGLKLREDAATGVVYAAEATEITVSSVSQLLSVVEKGAAARATAATDMNAHSSRSHALLVLTVERRWSAAAAGPGAGSSSDRTVCSDYSKPMSLSTFRSRIARLALVDLAGSECMDKSFRTSGGRADVAGIGTNMGLSALGRVVRARAAQAAAQATGNGSSGGAHVPYRDDPLTWLLKPYLSGNATAAIVACCSPAASDAAESCATLRFARTARTVTVQPVVSIDREVVSDDPMAGDVQDADNSLRRRTLWLEAPGFGDVFARVLGDPADPLVLYVHGSGPRNSSFQWGLMAPALETLAQASGGKSSSSEPSEPSAAVPRRFFHVAIDCPGYGRSPGDKQTVRSFPGDLLASVLRALGRRSACALVGSSQGAAAVLNALLERPGLARCAALVHPVTMHPERFRALALASVLAFYDVDDKGHPVAVGHRLRQALPRCRYFEFSSQESGEWDAQRLPAELLALIHDEWPSISRWRGAGRPVEALPDLTRQAGGFRSWSETITGGKMAAIGSSLGRALGTTGAVGATEAEEEVDEEDDLQPGSRDDSWRIVLQVGSGALRYEHVATGRQVALRPPGARVIAECIPSAARGAGSPGDLVMATVAAAATARKWSRAVFHRKASASSDRTEAVARDDDSEHSSEDESERVNRRRRQVKAAEELRANFEAAQTTCDRCRECLVEPLRLNECRCLLCGCCAETTVAFTGRCPCCGQKCGSAQRPPCPPVADDAMQHKQRQRQLLLLSTLRSERRASRCVVLEYGNSAEVAGPGKITFRVHVAVVTPARIPGASGLMLNDVARLLRSASFNINPRYAKPTAVVAAPDRAGRFAFEYAMGRSFPCVITLAFVTELGLPPFELNYTVQETTTFRRILVTLPAESPGLIRRHDKAALVLELNPPMDARVHVQTRAAMYI